MRDAPEAASSRLARWEKGKRTGAASARKPGGVPGGRKLCEGRKNHSTKMNTFKQFGESEKEGKREAFQHDWGGGGGGGGGGERGGGIAQLL